MIAALVAPGDVQIANLVMANLVMVNMVQIANLVQIANVVKRAAGERTSGRDGGGNRASRRWNSCW